MSNRLRILTAVVCLTLVEAAALGQRPERGGRRPAEPQGKQGLDRPDAASQSTEFRPPRPARDPLASVNPFAPSRDDLGPLAPEEERELMGFARRRLSGVFGPLDELRSRDPGAFRRRMGEFAPKLRMMRRLFDEDPEVAEKVVQHVTNMEQMRRVRRIWNANTRNPAAQQRARDEARRLLSENQRIEAEVLEGRADSLEARRDALMEQEFERLTSEDTEGGDMPPMIRRLLDDWRQSDTDERRARLEQEIRRRAGERIDMLAARLRGRAADLRASDAERLEQRVDEMLREPPPRPGDFAAPRFPPGRP